MAIDRVGITADLAYRYTFLLTEAGIPATDTSDGVKPVLDQVQATATRDATLTPETLGVYARYLMLDVIVERLATRFDVSNPRGSLKLNQLYTNAKSLRDSLAATIGWLAPGSAAATEAQIVTVTAPYLNDPYAPWPGGA